MSAQTGEQIREMVEVVYRSDSRRLFATLVRLLGDVDLGEDALHDAFTSAMAPWPRAGLPADPRTQLVSADRFEAARAGPAREQERRGRDVDLMPARSTSVRVA